MQSGIRHENASYVFLFLTFFSHANRENCSDWLVRNRLYHAPFFCCFSSYHIIDQTKKNYNGVMKNYQFYLFY